MRLPPTPPVLLRRVLLALPVLLLLLLLPGGLLLGGLLGLLLGGPLGLLRGTALDAEHISVAGAAIKGTGNALVAGQKAALAIRQHEIGLAPAGNSESANELRGRVVRCVFLGSNRDYVVELADGSQVKVTAEPRVIFPPGSEVALRLPRERCQLLSR